MRFHLRRAAGAICDARNQHPHTLWRHPNERRRFPDRELLQSSVALSSRQPVRTASHSLPRDRHWRAEWCLFCVTRSRPEISAGFWCSAKMCKRPQAEGVTRLLGVGERRIMPEPVIGPRLARTRWAQFALQAAQHCTPRQPLNARQHPDTAPQLARNDVRSTDQAAQDRRNFGGDFAGSPL